MSATNSFEALDLAALLCSRVCHDLISPVGAVVNGLEVLEDDNDEETKAFAMNLIKRSAQQASARLQFCRLAFGAAGSVGAMIDLGEALADTLALSLDPYPRSAGADAALKEAGVMSEEEASPFAILAKLRMSDDA